MKLQYKKVGDTFTQEEYNALCYLLTTDSWTETIEMKVGEKYYGKYATYELKDPNKILGETREGYAIIRNINNATPTQRRLQLVIYHDQMHSTFKATFRTSTRLEVLHAGQSDPSPLEDAVVKKEDFIDDISTDAKVTMEDDEEIHINTTELGTVESTALSNITSVIYLDPKEFNMGKGDYLYGKVDVTISYDKPILNITDGSLNQEDEILCEDWKTLNTVIKTAPEGSVTKIRLLGTEYLFDNEIHIDNKHVIIRGGNLRATNKPYTILNAQSIARHFIVNSKSSLTIMNCHLINGDAYGGEGRKVLHNYGGSIYVSSRAELKNEFYRFNKGKLRVDHCWFENNRAKLGGAVYNNKGNTHITNTVFYGNQAISEDRSQSINIYKYTTDNWGGAVFSETTYGKYHNDKSDKVIVDYAKYMSDSQLRIYFDKNQNSLILNRVPVTKDNVRLYNYTDSKFINISSISLEAQNLVPQYGDMCTINYAPSENLLNKKLYLIFEGNSAIPGVRSRTFVVGA